MTYQLSRTTKTIASVPKSPSIVFKQNLRGLLDRPNLSLCRLWLSVIAPLNALHTEMKQTDD